MRRLFVGKRAVSGSAVPCGRELCMCPVGAQELRTPPLLAGANFSDLRTIPTISTLFCNQRNPVIDP